MVDADGCSKEDNQKEDAQLVEKEACWKCHGHGKKKKVTPGTPTGFSYTGKTCTVCQGTGHRTASKRSMELALQPGRILPLRGKNGIFAGVPAVHTCRKNKKFKNDSPTEMDNDDEEDNVDAKEELEEEEEEEIPVHSGELVGALGCGDWRIFQLANGHKLTVDDFICAWVAAREMRQRGHGLVREGPFGQVPSTMPQHKEVFYHADLGCGCGSVLMMMLWAFPLSIRSHGVEAQQVSFDLCRRGLQWNVGKAAMHVSESTTSTTSTTTNQSNTNHMDDQSKRTKHLPDPNSQSSYTTNSSSSPSSDVVVELTHQDLRTWQGGRLAPYDIITATPPYFPKDQFVASANHPQKVRCRIPTRGAAADYIVAASRLLRGPSGILCLAETARPEGERGVLEAIQQEDVDLRVLRRVDVITRTGLPPRFSCWVLTPNQQSSTITATNTTASTTTNYPRPEGDPTIHNTNSNHTKNTNNEVERCSRDKIATKENAGKNDPNITIPKNFPIETFTIRSANHMRTLQYVEALEEMGWVDFEQTREKLQQSASTEP